MAKRSRWIFGYGSLVWRPAFPFVQRHAAFVRGYRRRFWQGSPDHRGTPARPGRVVTLIPAPRAEICWGVVYELPIPALDAIHAELEAREIAGYQHLFVDVFRPGAARPAAREVMAYVAGPENPSYLGPAALDEMARQIRAARGPSGENREYVQRLARALRELGGHDPDVFVLEGAVGSPIRGSDWA